MNKNESKYFNTAIRMDKALIELLDKKDFEYITIKEICKQANVNRSTFYLHYENTSYLLKEAIEFITNDFLSYFSIEKSKICFDFDKKDLNELLFITPDYVIPFLKYIQDNQTVFKTSYNHLGSMKLDTVYERMFNHIFNPILERFDFPENERKYVIKFYLTGVTAIVMEWIKNDCSDDIDVITNIITKCTIGNSKIDVKES
jgi:AcrR family transcriptional regulator